MKTCACGKEIDEKYAQCYACRRNGAELALKRERLATTFLNTLLHRTAFETHVEHNVELAVSYADALLKRLEKP